MTIQILYNDDSYLDPIVNSITWSGDISQTHRKLEVSLSNTTNGTEQAVPIELGSELKLIADGMELFHGIIFQHQIDAQGKMSITAYDENIYLTKNTDTKKFINMTASAIIRELCSSFEIPIGDIADTKYVIPKLILRDKTLRDMMITALTETQKQTGERFLLSAKQGFLHLIKRGEKRTDWIIDSSTNLFGASYSQSIEDMHTQIRVIGGDEDKNPIGALVTSPSLGHKYGVMQHLEHANSDMNMSQIVQMAERLAQDLGKIKDEARVESIGNVEVTAGSAIYVRDPMTRIVGAFYVITDSHVFEKGSHRMSLTLSGDEGLPQIDYEQPNEPDQEHG
ncbi:XkdQ/YqbQ family protein [Paenibacillus sp. UNC451MF]|uniref:XkdQ/YqbQ family protein n=1 Tax=Paenibacillus sp. UNC451MF TaxID=1449063 RepID=UPI000491CD08|nr:hypothetical protein [Paenibacillus sp. UNC451MF]